MPNQTPSAGRSGVKASGDGSVVDGTAGGSDQAPPSPAPAVTQTHHQTRHPLRTAHRSAVTLARPQKHAFQTKRNISHKNLNRASTHTDTSDGPGPASLTGHGQAKQACSSSNTAAAGTATTSTAAGPVGSRTLSSARLRRLNSSKTVHTARASSTALAGKANRRVRQADSTAGPAHFDLGHGAHEEWTEESGDDDENEDPIIPGASGSADIHLTDLPLIDGLSVSAKTEPMSGGTDEQTDVTTIAPIASSVGAPTTTTTTTGPATTTGGAAGKRTGRPVSLDAGPPGQPYQSRTERKLLLQRAASSVEPAAPPLLVQIGSRVGPSLIDRARDQATGRQTDAHHLHPTATSGPTGSNSPAGATPSSPGLHLMDNLGRLDPQLLRQYEQVKVEFRAVRRHRNPVRESLLRVRAAGRLAPAKDEVEPVRRTSSADGTPSSSSKSGGQPAGSQSRSKDTDSVSSALANLLADPDGPSKMPLERLGRGRDDGGPKSVLFPDPHPTTKGSNTQSGQSNTSPSTVGMTGGTTTKASSASTARIPPGVKTTGSKKSWVSAVSTDEAVAAFRWMWEMPVSRTR